MYKNYLFSFLCFTYLFCQNRSLIIVHPNTKHCIITYCRRPLDIVSQPCLLKSCVNTNYKLCIGNNITQYIVILGLIINTYISTLTYIYTHTHTHIHTHIYIYIYNNYFNMKNIILWQCLQFQTCITNQLECVNFIIHFLVMEGEMFMSDLRSPTSS